MFLSKHPNGTYYVYFTNDEGRRLSKSTRTDNRDKAYEFLIQFKQDLETKKKQVITPIRLKDFSFHYLKHSELYYTEKTQAVYKTTFNFMLNHFGNIFLSELTTNKIENYVHTRLKDSSIFAARRDFSNISSALNKAVRDGYLLSNPCKGIRRLQLPERQPLFYSKEDFQRLIAAIDNEDVRDLTLFAVNTGLRQNEMITLEWNQVDLDQKFVILNNQGTYITKTKRVRQIPLNKTAYEVVLKRKNNIHTQTDKQFVFTFRGAKIEQRYFTKYFKQFVIRAGVHPKLNFHSLRHTFASWLVQKNVSIYVVSKLLGHADIKTTQIYSHLRRDDLKDATDKLDLD